MRPLETITPDDEHQKAIKAFFDEYNQAQAAYRESSAWLGKVNKTFWEGIQEAYPETKGFKMALRKDGDKWILVCLGRE